MLYMCRQLLVPKNELDETPNGKSSENRLRVLLLENLNTEQQL